MHATRSGVEFDGITSGLTIEGLVNISFWQPWGGRRRPVEGSIDY
jgi:hypothetical protein